MEVFKDFIHLLKYKLHLTDWKKEKVTITYWTKREQKVRVIPTGLEVELLQPNGEVWIDTISITEK